MFIFICLQFIVSWKRFEHACWTAIVNFDNFLKDYFCCCHLCIGFKTNTRVPRSITNNQPYFPMTSWLSTASSNFCLLHKLGIVEGCFVSEFYYFTQGYQLPDFSLRFQTFCYTADFSTTFYICLKPKLFCTSHHKTTSKHPRIQEFCKKFWWPQTKTGKAPPLSWFLLGRPMTCGNAYVKHFAKFPDFSETHLISPLNISWDFHLFAVTC